MTTKSEAVSLRDQWQAHMDRTLPIDAPERQVTGRKSEESED